MKKKKRFIIQHRVNPKDQWEDFKKFHDEKKANQSLEMLWKHRSWPQGKYDHYRKIKR